MAKISTFLIGILLVAGMVALFGIAFTQLNDKYTKTDYSDANFANFQNKVNNITNNVDTTKSRALNITQQSGTLNVLEFYFGGAYESLKIAGQSLGIFTGMTENTLSQVNLGIGGDIVKSVLIGIIFITITFIIIKQITKVDV